jgi:hypothetical protein
MSRPRTLQGSTTRCCLFTSLPQNRNASLGFRRFAISGKHIFPTLNKKAHPEHLDSLCSPSQRTEYLLYWTSPFSRFAEASRHHSHSSLSQSNDFGDPETSSSFFGFNLMKVVFGTSISRRHRLRCGCSRYLLYRQANRLRVKSKPLQWKLSLSERVQSPNNTRGLKRGTLAGKEEKEEENRSNKVKSGRSHC